MLYGLNNAVVTLTLIQHLRQKAPVGKQLHQNELAAIIELISRP